MSELKEVRAKLNINVWVNCPHCSNFIDLMDDHDEDCYIINQVCDNSNDWRKDFECEEVECECCSEVFNVKEIEW